MTEHRIRITEDDLPWTATEPLGKIIVRGECLCGQMMELRTTPRYVVAARAEVKRAGEEHVAAAAKVGFHDPAPREGRRG